MSPPKIAIVGLEAIERCGLSDRLKEELRYDGESVWVVDHNFKTYMKMDGHTESSSNGRPEVDRGALSAVLLDALPDGIVRWGHRVSHISAGEITFENGTVEKGFDHIVGADGACSKVRPSFTDIKPSYVGQCGLLGAIPNVKAGHPDIAAIVNPGSLCP
ncbi:MAG: hypothetical protein MMC23_008825 [Stictis urceolatum]|nr:hypothetical protein [Stictis urceolata]